MNASAKKKRERLIQAVLEKAQVWAVPSNTTSLHTQKEEDLYSAIEELMEHERKWGVPIKKPTSPELIINSLTQPLKQMVRSLMERGRVDELSIARMVEGIPARDIPAVILEMAYDALPITVREDARNLSRGREISQHSKEYLEIAGWLDRRGQLPKPAKRFLSARANLYESL